MAKEYGQNSLQPQTQARTQVQKGPYITKDGFKIRVEARLKNAALIEARERLALSQERAAQAIGISLPALGDYERMQAFPSQDTIKKICDFYELHPANAFPEALKTFRPDHVYKFARDIPENLLISFNSLEHRLLPPVRNAIENQLEKQDLQETLNHVFEGLSPRQGLVLKMRYGLEPYDREYTLEEIGQKICMSRENVRRIEDKAILIIRHYPGFNQKLRQFLGSESEESPTIYVPVEEE